MVLAHSDQLLAALPNMVVPVENDTNAVGVWTWGNGLRMLIPWNLPLLMAVVHGAIVAVMAVSSSWLPIIEIDPVKLKKLKEKEEKEEIPGSVLAKDMMFRFGPVFLAVAAVLSVSLSFSHSDLKNKKVVAYEKGYVDWVKPEYGSQDDGFYGMLKVFVESLGGKFGRSKDLSEEYLNTADVLLLLHPNQPWPPETLERIWDFVRRGGSLLVAGDPAACEGDFQISFNDVLQPLAMHVRFDTAVTRTGNWEQSTEASTHPAAIGLDDFRNRFGLELGSSIVLRWPARPLLVGKWGWSDPGNDAAVTGGANYDAGERLGDLVLAAEQPLGQGRVVVLGGTSPLHNDMLPNSYPFAGRLLGYLANKPSSPQSLWRQFSAMAALAAMLALLACRPAAWQLILTPSVLAVSLICCTEASHWSGQVLPDGRSAETGIGNNVAYIDASHMEAYSDDLMAKHGIAALTRTLMRHGYLPLFAPDLRPERLERAGLLISIAPAREFSFAEREAVKSFVLESGTFICLVGAEEARPSAELLDDFGFKVPHSPVPPNEDVREPEPFGSVYGRTVEKNWNVPFYAAWPVESEETDVEKMVFWPKDSINYSLVLRRSDGGGSVVVIGDTQFASNENAEYDETASTNFWRWLLTRVVAGQKAWDPPPSAEGAGKVDSDQNEEKTTEENDQ
jgi:hypothetical protein